MFGSKHEDVPVTVVSRTRSRDGESFEVVMKETGGRGRTFTQTFDYYGPGGRSNPKPLPGSRAIVRLNRFGKVVYAGSAT